MPSPTRMLLLGLALGFLSSGCTDAPVEPRPALRGLVLVVNDTMRRDRMGFHGGPALTARYDGFAREHAGFAQAYSQAPWTKPSIATLFTGLYPGRHAVISHPQEVTVAQAEGGLKTISVVGNDRLSDELTTMAEAFAAAGWRTGAFVANPWLGADLGFAQGFETYDDSFAGWETPGERITQAGLDWLERLESGERFFLYLHYMDSHRPYGRLRSDDLSAAASPGATGSLDPAEAAAMARNLRLEDGRSLAALGQTASVGLLERAYDRGIERFDQALGQLLDGLQDREAWSETAVLVTSDHGEALYTRGYGNHGRGLYEDEIAVPLALRLPGIRRDRLPTAEPVGLIDVLPTLCDYLDLPCPGDLAGDSWLDPVPADPVLITEGVTGAPRNRAVRHDGYKLLLQVAPGPDGSSSRLYRIVEDPLEQSDLLAGEQPSEEALARARALVDAGAARAPDVAKPAAEQRELDPETAERLRALGYID